MQQSIGSHGIWVRGSRSQQQSIEEFTIILQKLALMGAIDRSKWQLSVDVVQHKFAKEKLFYKVRIDSDAFIVFQNNVIQVQSDEGIVGLLESLKKFQIRSPQSLTLEGFQVVLGDFRVRIGKGMISAFQMAITVIDVEYIAFEAVQTQILPAIEEMGNLIIDVFKGISNSGSFSPFPFTIASSYQKFHLPMKMSFAHYALDYAYLVAYASKIPSDNPSS
jgi:hypothetical protein